MLGRLKPTALRADVLKAGHHGSETGSREPFLKALEPRVVVIMSGRRSFNGRWIRDEAVVERYVNLDSNPLVVLSGDSRSASATSTVE